jgi:hypothetical protein
MYLIDVGRQLMGSLEAVSELQNPKRGIGQPLATASMNRFRVQKHGKI